MVKLEAERKGEHVYCSVEAGRPGQVQLCGALVFTPPAWQEFLRRMKGQPNGKEDNLLLWLHAGTELEATGGE